MRRLLRPAGRRALCQMLQHACSLHQPRWTSRSAHLFGIRSPDVRLSPTARSRYGLVMLYILPSHHLAALNLLTTFAPAQCDNSDCLRDDTVCGRCNALCTDQLCRARCANSLECGGPNLNATLSCEAEFLREGATLEERCDNSYINGATAVKCRSRATDGTCGNEDYCLACIESCEDSPMTLQDFSVTDCVERCEMNPICCARDGGSCVDAMGSCEAFKIRLGTSFGTQAVAHGRKAHVPSPSDQFASPQIGLDMSTPQLQDF